MISSVGLAHYGVAGAKDWVSVDCDTRVFIVCFASQFVQTSFIVKADANLVTFLLEYMTMLKPML